MNKLNFPKTVGLHHIGFSLLLMCLSCSATAKKDDKQLFLIQDFIEKQALENKAVEFKEAREIVIADLNGDEKEDATVLYSLESFDGGNLYLQYLAVFISSKNNELLYITQEVVGGKNFRSVDLESIFDGNINLTALTYLPTDPSCCPSKKEDIRFLLHENRLKQIK